jgi:23S rRNA pseudouridine2605 synthase
MSFIYYIYFFDGETEHILEKKEIRLQKFISECGIASRRKAEVLIAEGHVKVNGRISRIGDTVNPIKDRVTVDGTPIKPNKEKIYIALNKPRGYVTTLNDEFGRKNVTELISGIDARLYPVGRLDKDSEGLLLLTDDGTFANALTHPSHHVAKVYRVSVNPEITEQQLLQIEQGIELDGIKTAPAKAKLIRQEKGRAVVEIILYEGRNRQIRRMCEAMGLEVARLNRIAVGNVKLGGLASGEYRELEPNELKSLFKVAGLSGKKAE